MPPRKIGSWEELQQQIQAILERVNADPDLAAAAAINPILALEELGYELEPGARQEVEDRLRFDPREAVRLRQLRKAAFEQAGREFDLDSPDELGRLLFEELRIPIPQPEKKRPRQKRPAARPDTRPLPHRFSGQPEAEDPLEALHGAHPVLEPLLEYRRLEASRPRLASRSLYEQVRQGKRRLAIRNLRGRLKAPPD